MVLFSLAGHGTCHYCPVPDEREPQTMQVSFCMMGFGYTQEIAERCIALVGRHGLGYDGIELWKQYLDHADLAWVRRSCEANGLAIVQVCPYFDFTTSQQTYEDTLREAERFVEY